VFLAPCSYEAAKFAVMRWHYSKAMPKSRLVRIGVWSSEGGSFDGSIIYGRGASVPLYRSMGARMTEMVELTRVALRPQALRKYPTSKALGVSLRILKRVNPGLGVVVSFADKSGHGHIGTIYQATNWVFLGMTKGTKQFYERETGKTIHSRTVNNWPKNDPRRIGLELVSMPKLRYAYPLNEEWRTKLAERAQEYPL
jgi:hypothetical protein